MFNRSVTKIDAVLNVYVAGAVINGFNNSDLLLQKFNRSGVLLWQQEYAGAAEANDFATDLFIDNSGNVYVTGSVVDSVSQGNDLIVVKYNSSGIFQWKYTATGSSIYLLDDAGTAITGDNVGQVYVAGSMGGDTTLMDFVTIALNANTGAQLWKSQYDYDGLIEIPSKIRYQSKFGYGFISIAGASQENHSTLRWEVAAVLYNATNGTEIAVTRTNTSTISQTGADIGDVYIDDSNNIYVTGSLYNDINFSNDIALMKFNPDLELMYLYMYDFNGNNDKGKGIKTDNLGNVYITGYSTFPGVGKEIAVIKIDNTGTVVWQREITGPDGGDDEGVQLAIKDTNIYVIAKVRRNNNYDFDLYMLTQDGEIVTSASYNTANLHDEPQSIAIDLNGDIVITGIFQTGISTFENKTFKYTVHEKQFEPVYNINGQPVYNKNELTIRF